MNKTLEVLKEARRLLSIGWIQEASNIGDGYCVSGAITQAANAMMVPYMAEPTGNFAKRKIYDLIPFRIGIIDWNDTPGRTQAEVLALMDKAIENETLRYYQQTLKLVCANDRVTK